MQADLKILSDLSLKMITDVLAAMKLTTQLIEPPLAPTLVAHTLQNLVASFSVHSDMPDADFTQWLALMQRTRVMLQNIAKNEAAGVQ